MNMIPRNEYPRPNFVRAEWFSLNGIWDFSFDKETYDRQIMVPYAYESEMSGIKETKFHKTVWYRRNFSLPHSMQNKQIILHFGAVDYYCKVWINDRLVKEHIGGQTSFSVNISEVINYSEDNTIRLQVLDDHADLEMSRGKQFWEEESRSIFYTRTTGIWQSVWIEAVSENHLKNVFITPYLDEQSVRFEYNLEGKADLTLEAQISYKGTHVTDFKVDEKSMKGCITISLNQPALRAWNFTEELTWSPEHPRLFDVTFRVYQGEIIEDEVTSYFAMRKVSVENGVFKLNNRPYYQKLLLDQGYWPESLLTAPTDEAFIKDIQLVKEMGFNGVRKHQKVEDPRFFYHADIMGLLVWGEIGSAYEYSREYASNMYREWSDTILRDYNHPCIVVWTPLNESWGVPFINNNRMQQGHCNAMMYLTKSLDDTRVVIDNDGWEHTCGDLLTIHDYESVKDVLEKRYESLENILLSAPCGRQLFVSNYKYQNQPIIISECGGIKMHAEENNGWGYSVARSEEDFLQRYHDIIDTFLNSNLIQGYCYTQLTDIEQETNGLLTYDRNPKVPLEEIRKINEGTWKKVY
ncbi:MAG: glycoside hydrolase family 2 [Anaerolineaceae bacterium]|nr:MAG: glycoside hydrolase family 2 [Anaerolineaceae bacterium]